MTVISINKLKMDPKPSFHIPLLHSIRTNRRRSLPSNMEKFMNNTTHFAFRDDKDSMCRETRLHVELSPQIGMRLNPGYRPDNFYARSIMQRDYKNHAKKANRQKFMNIDKHYYKTRDDMGKYTEHKFRNQIICRK